MIGNKAMREAYDRYAEEYVKMLRFHRETQKAVFLGRVERGMSNLDKSFAILGEE